MRDAEYLVVIDLLNRPRGRERSRTYRALRNIEATLVDAAIAGLEDAGVVVVKGKSVRASPSLERLEQLNLIGV